MTAQNFANPAPPPTSKRIKQKKFATYINNKIIKDIRHNLQWELQWFVLEEQSKEKLWIAPLDPIKSKYQILTANKQK